MLILLIFLLNFSHASECIFEIESIGKLPLFACVERKCHISFEDLTINDVVYAFPFQEIPEDGDFCRSESYHCYKEEAWKTWAALNPNGLFNPLNREMLSNNWKKYYFQLTAGEENTAIQFPHFPNERKSYTIEGCVEYLEKYKFSNLNEFISDGINTYFPRYITEKAFTDFIIAINLLDVLSHDGAMAELLHKELCFVECNCFPLEENFEATLKNFFQVYSFNKIHFYGGDGQQPYLKQIFRILPSSLTRLGIDSKPNLIFPPEACTFINTTISKLNNFWNINLTFELI